jgi:hypothetical protein
MLIDFDTPTAEASFVSVDSGGSAAVNFDYTRLLTGVFEESEVA